MAWCVSVLVMRRLSRRGWVGQVYDRTRVDGVLGAASFDLITHW